MAIAHTQTFKQIHGVLQLQDEVKNILMVAHMKVQNMKYQMSIMDEEMCDKKTGRKKYEKILTILSK